MTAKLKLNESGNEGAVSPIKLPQKLGSEVCSRICAEVQEGAARIFDKNLVFGFVCGGVAKGYADDSHDIDVVVCTDYPMDEETTGRYYDWYFNLHERYTLPPDYDYPGEVVTYQQFADTLELLRGLELSLHVTDVKVKKAIIWGDMITGGIAGKTGRTDLIDEIIEKYKDEPARWKEQVLALITPEERAQWADQNHTLIMERFMRYPKHDGKKLESRYGRK